jgi:Spy/CpxP family protein refolding chaperone
MIKNLLIALALIGTAATAQTRPNPGQRPGARPGQTKERIESAKIGFITRELQLTPDEAKAFWPIYNAMEAELKKANRDPLREGLKTVRGEGGIDNLSDAQARELLAELDKAGAEREAVRRKYQKEFLKVLPPQKVLKLHVAERKFKQEVMERLRDARKGEGAAPRA